MLSLLSSSFAFVLADSTRHAVLAARSPPAAAAAASPVAPPHHVGATPTAPLPEPPALWWATARDGTLLFGTAEPPLARACARPETGPAPFPGGCTFFEAQAWAGGRLAAFGRAPGRRDVTPVRRVNSKGVLCALGWHSASGAELAAIPAAVRV